MTGAVKQGRNTDSQAANAGGTRYGSGTVVPFDDARRFIDADDIFWATR